MILNKSNRTIFVKPKDIEKKWYLIDAANRELGDVAVACANILRGKNKPEYAPLHDNGDYVIVINADKIVLSGKKEDTKAYFRHSGYPGGLRRESFKDMIARKPCFPLETAVKGMLPKGPLGRKIFLNMKVYATAEHPHGAQNPISYEF